MGEGAWFQASLTPYTCGPEPSVGIQHLLKKRCSFFSSQNENGQSYATGGFSLSLLLTIFHDEVFLTPWRLWK